MGGASHGCTNRNTNRMRIWISGTAQQVVEMSSLGIAECIVTDPTVQAQWTEEGHPLTEVVRVVTDAVGVPVYMQLRGPEHDDFLREMDYFAAVSPLIRPKIPATAPGMSATRRLAADGHQVLVTAVGTLAQAYVAGAAGAVAIAPYVAETDEWEEGAAAQLIRDAVAARGRLPAPLVIPGSIRTTTQAEDAIRAGADGIIVYVDLYWRMLEHPVTRESLRAHEEDWRTARAN